MVAPDKNLFLIVIQKQVVEQEWANKYIQSVGSGKNQNDKIRTFSKIIASLLLLISSVTALKFK